MSENKKNPNPHGRLGGEKHQQKVPEVAGAIEKKGLPVKRERDTIEEIKESKNVAIYFHSYNKD